jgi:hypothetical protein
VGWGDVDWIDLPKDRSGFQEMLGNYLVASRVVLSSI